MMTIKTKVINKQICTTAFTISKLWRSHISYHYTILSIFFQFFYHQTFIEILVCIYEPQNNIIKFFA